MKFSLVFVQLLILLVTTSEVNCKFRKSKEDGKTALGPYQVNLLFFFKKKINNKMNLIYNSPKNKSTICENKLT